MKHDIHSGRGRSWAVVLAVLVLGLILGGCARNAQPAPEGRGESMTVQSDEAAPAPALAPARQAGGSAPRAPAPAALVNQAPQVPPIEAGERLIVKTGNLAMQVEDIADAAAKTRQLAESYSEGFVVSSVQREENGRPIATVSIRVPATRFEEAMERLRALADRVTSEQISSRDITEEFVDVDARLRNLQRTEQRYVDLLAQARTVEDILKIEQQLANIRTQIEQLQGRKNFLEQSAALSTISVELRLPPAARTPPPTDWALQPVLLAALQALQRTFQLLLSLAIFVVVFAPVWLPLGALVWFLRRRWRARRGDAPPTAGAPATVATPPRTA